MVTQTHYTVTTYHVLTNMLIETHGLPKHVVKKHCTGGGTYNMKTQNTVRGGGDI